MNERILALDIGDARIGVAVSDPGRIIASPVEVIHRVGWGPDVRRIRELCEQYETTLVLSGWPLNMDGTSGFQSEKVRLFCEQLENAGLQVFYQDERRTPVTAEHALLEGNMHRRERRQTVDKVAAAVILQQWLDSARNSCPVRSYHLKEDAVMEENNIIELIDESGETVPFEHLATIEHDGAYYIALAELPEEDEGPEDAEYEVILMKITQDENGVDCYVQIEDEQEQQAVFDKFLALMEEEEADDE